PGRLVRSVEDMSRMAALTDGIRPADRTNWSITTISYYPFGAAIALALDLTLRGRSEGRVTLDDFMREMWQRYGKPGGARQGHVDRPYAVSDAEAVLADIAGDPALARDFFARYVQGRELADYARLLAPAGFVLRPAAPGRAWLGDLQLGAGGDGAAIATLVAPTWPIYAAGVDQFDEIRQLDGVRIGSMDDVENVLRRHTPGDRLTMVFVDRTGRPTAGTVTLAEDPHLRVVPMEAEGGALTAAQRAFRTRWLGPR
ncbi:MAG TPA: hypothetical protein VJK49_00700, partial [Candidatus Limnocylindrales bacterium]|nr:hypothetical protein [Candidatus Limnocylindrales bacterium]